MVRIRYEFLFVFSVMLPSERCGDCYSNDVSFFAFVSTDGFLKLNIRNTTKGFAAAQNCRVSKLIKCNFKRSEVFNISVEDELVPLLTIF